MSDMTTMTNSGRIPELTLGWRLRLALGEISVQKMADDLGYSRSTLSRWLNDQDVPRSAVLAQWALVTNVDRGWLETGVRSNPIPPDGPGSRASPKLEQLAEQKRARTTGSRTTHRYVPAAA